jgi:uncharacterized protein (TIGR00255 family)
MTGFGRGSASDTDRIVTCEMRAVNHRYAEFFVRLPRKFSFAEDSVRNTLRSQIKRGKVDVSVQVESVTGEDMDLVVNLAVASQYVDAVRALKNEFGLTGEVTVEMLSSQPDVLSAGTGTTDEDAILKVIELAVRDAIKNFNGMRRLEGERLSSDLLDRVEVCRDIVREIETRAPELTQIYADKLRARIDELTSLAGTVALEERIALETAVIADKSSITEELVRLQSHLAQIEIVLQGSGDEPAGKRLDFLMQEMNRETNTIGAKANDLKITNLMLDLKSEVEKIREQVQNLE